MQNLIFRQSFSFKLFFKSMRSFFGGNALWWPFIDRYICCHLLVYVFWFLNKHEYNPPFLFLSNGFSLAQCHLCSVLCPRAELSVFYFCTVMTNWLRLWDHSQNVCCKDSVIPHFVNESVEAYISVSHWDLSLATWWCFRAYSKLHSTSLIATRHQYLVNC